MIKKQLETPVYKETVNIVVYLKRVFNSALLYVNKSPMDLLLLTSARTKLFLLKKIDIRNNNTYLILILVIKF